MLKKHLKKIVSLVLVTMMAIGMSITAIAAEPYQNELEAVMDTSLADSGQVTHYDTYTSNSEYGVDYTWTVPAKTGYYYVAYTITDYDNATSGSGVTTTALSNRTGHAWNFNFSDSVSGKSLPMPPANYAKGATTTRPSNLDDTYYNTYTANTGVTLNRSLYDVHHIRPLAYGGSNAYSNLIHLPKATHTQVTSWWAGY